MMTHDWSEFSARAYLNEYYADMGEENLALVQFLVDAFKQVSPSATVLDFGGGPTLYTLIAAAATAREIHFCDFLESNLDELRLWLNNDAAAFDWTQFIKTTLVLENQDDSEGSVLARAAQIRQRTTLIMRCDANLARPLYDQPYTYDVLVSNFCVESATEDYEEWKHYFRNMTSLLKPGGQLIMATLKGATSYSVGAQTFPAVSIQESHLHTMFIETGFLPKSIQITSVPADRISRHYQGLLMAVATKTAAVTAS